MSLKSLINKKQQKALPNVPKISSQVVFFGSSCIAVRQELDIYAYHCHTVGVMFKYITLLFNFVSFYEYLGVILLQNRTFFFRSIVSLGWNIKWMYLFLRYEGAICLFNCILHVILESLLWELEADVGRSEATLDYVAMCFQLSLFVVSVFEVDL